LLPDLFPLLAGGDGDAALVLHANRGGVISLPLIFGHVGAIGDLKGFAKRFVVQLLRNHLQPTGVLEEIAPLVDGRFQLGFGFGEFGQLDEIVPDFIKITIIGNILVTGYFVTSLRAFLSEAIL